MRPGGPEDDEDEEEEGAELRKAGPRGPLCWDGAWDERLSSELRAPGTGREAPNCREETEGTTW